MSTCASIPPQGRPCGRSARRDETAPEWITVKQNVTGGAPSVGDDSVDGYTIGSRWYDTTGDAEYVCLDASAGAAVWTKTTP